VKKFFESPTITFATFPQREVKPALTKSNVARRPEISRQRSELKQHFLERFGPEAASPDDGRRRTVIAQNLETMKFFAPTTRRRSASSRSAKSCPVRLLARVMKT
jgi:hypothetical protein